MGKENSKKIVYGNFKTEVQADLKELNRVLFFVEDSLKKKGFKKEFITSMKFIADELFANIAMYAYEGSGEALRTAEIEIITEGTIDADLNEASEDAYEAMLMLSDRGIPYNPLEHEDPDVSLPAEDRKEGGLGIYLVRSMADRAEYEYKDGRNIIRVWKKAI